MIELFDEVVLGDCLDLFPAVADESVRTIHTSPPYNIERSYDGYRDKLSRDEYLDFLGNVLAECKRVLVGGGSLFWQTGYTTEDDTYITPLDHLTFDVFLRLGFRLKDRIIWRYWGGTAFKSKFTNKHETILWWVKHDDRSEPLFNVFPVREATKFHDARNNLFGRNPGNVWEVDRVAFGSSEQTSHIAVFPEEISDRIILATTREGDMVLDPFSGSGTVCKIAKARGRHFLGFEISPLYHAESVRRLSFQAKGELLSVLSEIVKEHVLKLGEPGKVGTVADKLTALLSPLSVEPYARMIPKHHLDALCAGREDGVRKCEKTSLWKDLEHILGPVASRQTGDDPVGLVGLVDRAFLRAFKLHRVYNSAMRFYCAARWIQVLRSMLARDKKEAWPKILHALVATETGAYRMEADTMTLVAREGKAKQGIAEARSRVSRGRHTSATLF